MSRDDLLELSLFHLLRAMPATLCSDLGAMLAPRFGKRPHPSEHRNVKALFAALRPDWATSDAALEQAADRLWANITRTFAEFAVSHRMLRAGRVAIEGRGLLEAALTSGRPIVAIFPHLGNWELSEMQFGFLAPHRGAVIVAPPANTTRARIADTVRRQVPAELLPVSKTVWRQALARLKMPGGGVMIAVDEEVNGQCRGPAFSGTPSLDGNLGKAARLAMLTDALVVPFYNERLPGTRFVTHYLPPLELVGRSSDNAALSDAVLRLDAVFQAPIRRLLDQWYMAMFAKP